MTTPTHRMVNGVEVPLTADEVAAILAEWNAPPPPAPPHEVRKLLIIERIGPTNYPNFAAALATLTDFQRARWEAARTVYSDDADAIALLAAIGLDPAVILSPEA